MTAARRVAILVVALSAPAVAPADPAPSPVAGRVEFPQVKIDRVDADDPGDWRVVVSALGEGGAPMPLAEMPVSLFLAQGHGQVRLAGEKPLASFVDGRAAKGFRGKLYPLEKAPVTQAAVLVVALHSGVPGDVWRILGKALPAALEGLRPDASVGVVLYGDAVSVLWSPDGRSVHPRDINDFQHCLKSMREGASDPAAGEAEGTACGRLFRKPADLKEALKSVPALQGMFPRLMGIPESDETRRAAARRGHTPLDSADPVFVGERLAGGALEAALRLLLAGSPPRAIRDVILVSDGRDGYLGVADAAGDRHTRECGKTARSCRVGRRGAGQKDAGGLEAFEGASKECTREVLECTLPKVAVAMQSRENAVRDHLTAVVQAFRAANVRVTAVAIPGTEEVGAARLQALAQRTGGTYRAAAGTSALQGTVAQAAKELAARIVLRPARGLDAGGDFTAVVVAGSGLSSPGFRFTTGSRAMPWSGPYAGARGFAIRRLGHTWGPVLLWVALVLGTVLVLLFLYGSGKAVAAVVKGLGKPKLPKKPPTPKMPTIKRPGAGV